MKTKTRGLLARKMTDPAYRRRHKKSYELFKLEVKRRNASSGGDMPELTETQLASARRVTPEETEKYRRAIERKLGIPKSPRRSGRFVKKKSS